MTTESFTASACLAATNYGGSHPNVEASSDENLVLLDVVLGHGRSSTVHLGRNESGEYVAVKVFSTSWCAQNRADVIRELVHHRTMSAYRHPFVLELRGATTIGHPAVLATVLEYIDGALTLDKFQEQHGGVLPIHMARRLFQQLVLAVEFCHRLGKVNRDLKLSDILVDSSCGDVQLKLCDFSFTKDTTQDSVPHTQLGTALFAAPEIVMAVPGTAYDGAAADVWSLGVILCTLLFGQHPFLPPSVAHLAATEQVLHILSNSVSGALQLPPHAMQQHPDAYHLLSAMLATDPGLRPTAADVTAHPFFRSSIPSEWLVLNDNLLADAEPLCGLSQQLLAQEVTSMVDRVLVDARAEAEAAGRKGGGGGKAAGADHMLRLFESFARGSSGPSSHGSSS